jgi:hypothetical protein
VPITRGEEQDEIAVCGPRVRAYARAQDGQAAVELVALLPLVALVAAVLWQLALAGHATWAAGAAARAGARAVALGQDPRQAARSALPSDLRHGLRISEGGNGAISVHVRIPAVTPGLDLGRTSARAHFPAQGA